MDEHALDDLQREYVRDLFDGVDLRTIVVPVQGLEWRESGSGDKSRIFTGYAAVFGQRTVLYDGTYFRWTELIDAKAFDNVLASDPDVHFNMGHDMNKSMARTKAPGPLSKLELTADDHGLRVYARLNPENRTVQELIPLMEDGVMDQMSFAFRLKASGRMTLSTTDTNGKTTDDDTILDIAELIDVCICAQGAYPTTEASLRQRMDAAFAPKRREVAPDGDGAQGSPAVSPDPDGAGTIWVDPKLVAARAQALAARTRFSQAKG